MNSEELFKKLKLTGVFKGQAAGQAMALLAEVIVAEIEAQHSPTLSGIKDELNRLELLYSELRQEMNRFKQQ